MTDQRERAAGLAFVSACRHRFDQGMIQIEHCLGQLSDDDLYWRAFDAQNSIMNILLHLRGNVRQWIIAGVGLVPDTRVRYEEFTERERRPRAELIEGLRTTVADADRVLARLTERDLTASRMIQSYETTVADAIVDTTAHFEGHVQEITLITRLRRQDQYRFRWTPTTIAEGAPPAL